jgi:hypothetical protein
VRQRCIVLGLRIVYALCNAILVRTNRRGQMTIGVPLLFQPEVRGTELLVQLD